MASELKIAIAFFLDRRSLISSSVDRARPKRIARTRPTSRSPGVRATLAARLAVSCPGPV